MVVLNEEVCAFGMMCMPAELLEWEEDFHNYGTGLVGMNELRMKWGGDIIAVKGKLIKKAIKKVRDMLKLPQYEHLQIKQCGVFVRDILYDYWDKNICPNDEQ